MKRLLAFLSAVLLVGCTTVVNVSQPASPDYSLLRAATWQLTGEHGSCSGVLIAPHYMLTAAHCEGVGPKIFVGGKEAFIVKKDSSIDTMLLMVQVSGPMIPVAEFKPFVDDQVVVVGYPLGIGQYLTEGRVQGAPDPEQVPPYYMLVSAPGSFGNSGGPAFVMQNGQWRVAGIVSAGAFGLGLSTHIILVVNTDSLNKFLNK